jgi:hypothetical protein
MSDVSPEREWFEKADQDLEMARRALGPEKPLPGMACYHAQQCAEKYLKGYLIANSVPFRFVLPNSRLTAYSESLRTDHGPGIEASLTARTRQKRPNADFKSPSKYI